MQDSELSAARERASEEAERLIESARSRFDEAVEAIMARSVSPDGNR